MASRACLRTSSARESLASTFVTVKRDRTSGRNSFFMFRIHMRLVESSIKNNPCYTSTTVNLPNTLTLLRIFIVPLLVVVLLTPFSENLFGVPRHVLGVLMFLGAALTDYLDGRLARSRGQVTRLGQLLDPIADKLLISAALISLVENQLAPARSEEH